MLKDQITFKELNLIEPLNKALAKNGYQYPTPIQLQAIPLLLEGQDLLGCAQTGTGKTAAFVLPLLQNLRKMPKAYTSKRPRILVLTPTRELAIQVHDSFKTYGRFLNLKTSVIFGGVGQVPQVRSMSTGVDVLVATPGRLLDLIRQRYVVLKDVEFFVLDEADRMLDMGFLGDIKKIISELSASHQNLFFSATMPKEIEALANEILSNPVVVTVNPVSSTVEHVNQLVMHVQKENKRKLLEHLFLDNALKKVIIFTRTKHGANRVSDHLTSRGILTNVIHGNKSQGARQHALHQFKNGRIRALIATDIASRGIDVDDITHVVNFDLPNEPENYVHRIGRTARAGAKGTAISFCDEEERGFLRQIQKLIKKELTFTLEHPFHLASSEAYSFKLSEGGGEVKTHSRNRRNSRRPSFRRKNRKPNSL